DLAPRLHAQVFDHLLLDRHALLAEIAHLPQHGTEVGPLRHLDCTEPALRRLIRRQDPGELRTAGALDERDLVGRRREMRAAVEGVDAPCVTEADAPQELLDASRLCADL